MSSLHPGDADMHYSDGSHRWLAPVHIDQKRWKDKVGRHMQEHLSTMGGDLYVETKSGLRGHPKGW